MYTFKHSVYLAASWSDEHQHLNSYVADKLANQFGLLIVGDHKIYRDTPHERGLTYADRVNEILQTCSGMVVVFPWKEYSQTTAPFIFLELLLAIKHQLPVLMFCEEGVKLEWREIDCQILLTFGDSNSHNTIPISVDTVCKDAFRVAALREAHSVVFRTSTFINKPIFLKRKPLDTAEISASLSSLVEEYTNSFRTPEKQGYVFNVMPYAKEPERLVIATAVFEETGYACINASDTWSGGPFTRDEIAAKISDAFFVVADLSGVSSACIFEVGIAVGSGKDTFVLTNTRRKPLPFGVDRLPMLVYSNERELDKAVRVHCRAYRRRVFNIELLQQAGERPARDADRVSARQVVLLVHGIRTQGEWQEMVRGVLQYGTRATVIPIKYGYLDAARFWLPFGTRRTPVDTIRWKIRKAVSLHPSCDVAVIAHSFGTYAIAQILTQEPSFRPKRVLFCASIVRQNFRWDMLDNCPELLNDCSGRDVWPILASALTVGYGPSGTFGFGTPGVHDRYHNFKHSDYFQRDFVERFWKPWLDQGRIVGSQYEGKRRTTPYWMSLLTISAFRILLVLGILLLVYLLSNRA